MKNNKVLVIVFVLSLVGIYAFYVKINVNTNNNYKKEEVNESSLNEEVLADTSTPKLIAPYYNTNHNIVADFVLSAGSGDMTSAIQKALDKCNDQGGGVVWLNRGIYNVSSPITVPKMCSLMGDYQDPDNYHGTLDYGTKIVVDVKKFKSDNSDLDKTGLFKIESSAGVEGLTVYYKNQDINNIVSQPWSFFYDDEYPNDISMLFTVRNVTLINAYRGVGTSLMSKTHEMLKIDNVKGTVLNKGIVDHGESDVGTIVDVKLKPKYWATANLKAFNDSVSNPSESTIVSKIKATGGVGMILTDIDLPQMANIEISGYKWGIYLPDASSSNMDTRGSGDVSIYNLNISNCQIGIYVTGGKKPTTQATMLDYRMGYIISNAKIEGSEYAILNNSEEVYNQSSKFRGRGTLKFHDVEIKGKVGGNGVLYYNSSKKDYDNVQIGVNLTGKINNTGKFSVINRYRNKKSMGTNFAYLSSSSSVDTINSTLKSISDKGGGVVYLRPGKYTIDSTINIPANTELRGSSGVSGRVYTKGTTFDVVFTKKSTFRAVSIIGDNAGISGINFIYKDTIDLMEKAQPANAHDWAIIAENVKNIYVKNISMAAAGYGIYIHKCSNFTVENIVAFVVRNYIHVSDSSNGLITDLLHNPNVMSRNKLYKFTESQVNRDAIYNDTLVKNTFILLNNSSDIELLDCFAYRVHKFLEANNSSFYAINMTHDDSNKGNTKFFENNNSNGVVVNALKWSNANSVDNVKGTKVGVYNVGKVYNIKEKDVPNNIFKLSKKYITSSLSVSSSVTFDSLSSKKISYQYDGDGKVSCTSSNTSYVKCSINSSKQVVITPVKNTNGSVSITISATAGVNYTAVSKSINVTVSASKSVKGDVDGDGKVISKDYILVKRHVMNIKTLSEVQKKRADINNDSKITASDYIAIKKIVLSGGSK